MICFGGPSGVRLEELDGKRYEIDVCGEHDAALTAALTPLRLGEVVHVADLHERHVIFLPESHGLPGVAERVWTSSRCVESWPGWAL